jgi:hypothetical protein
VSNLAYGDGFGNVMSAYDCCVIAITKGTITSGQLSQAWSWIPATKVCLSWNDQESCPNPPNMDVRVSKAGNTANKAINGNSYCGQITRYA